MCVSQNAWYSAMARMAGSACVSAGPVGGVAPAMRSSALDGGIGNAVGVEQAGADGLDGGAGIAAREIGEPVEGPLPRPPQPDDIRV